MSSVLPDLIGPNLRIVFTGTAVGAASARAGAYYAGPGNAFWPTLHAVGLTPRRLAPREFRTLLDFGIGLTDVCKVASGSDREIGSTSRALWRSWRPTTPASSPSTASEPAVWCGVDR